MKRSLLQLLSVLSVAFAITGCGESYSWNQKLTVVIETPEGTKSASSVTTARLRNKSGWLVPPEAGGASFSLRGEAVVLEVSPGQYLFVLLRDMPRAYELFYPDEKSGLKGARALENAATGQTIQVPPDKYPMLVTYRDIANAASAAEVKPSNLTEFFGPGVALTSITLSISDEPTTKGSVEKVLVWVRSPTILNNARWASLPRIAKISVYGLIGEDYYQ